MTSQSQLTTRIKAIKGELVALGDLRPGTLSEQYNVCGTPGCRCKSEPPQKHGPRYQLSYTRHGRGHTESIRPERLADVQAQLHTYQQLQALVQEWVDASIEIDRLRRADTQRRR